MKCSTPFCNRAQTRDNMARFETDWFQYLGAVPLALEHNFSKIRKKASPHFGYMIHNDMPFSIPFCKGAQTRDSIARFETDCVQYQAAVPVTLENHCSKIRKKASPHFGYMLCDTMMYRNTFCKGAQTRDNIGRFETDWCSVPSCSTSAFGEPLLKNTEKGISTFWIYAV